MEANKRYILRDIIGANKTLFKIPVYQRNYDWADYHCIRLLKDIAELINTPNSHFTGTIVYMMEKFDFGLTQVILIDGQQRLTTIMLILKALSDCSKTIDGDNTSKEIDDTFLCNKWCDEKYKIKLKPVKTDNEQFTLLMDDKFDDMNIDSHIYINYKIIKETFDKWIIKGVKAMDILDALTRLQVVEIVLDEGKDDPQIIFESINSTGLDLSNSDLIRNFLLMNCDNQEYMYENYWLYIEKALTNGVDYKNLDFFMAMYLTFKLSAPMNSKDLYRKFIKLFDDENYTKESMLEELKYYCDIFKLFIHYDKDRDTEFTKSTYQSLAGFRALKQTTIYPFLFHLFDDYKNNIIDQVILAKVLKFLLSYLIRRIVCGSTSNTLRGLFVYLYNRIFKVSINKKKYYESINKFFFTLNTKDVIPTDDEFRTSLKYSNLYSNNAVCKFILMDIENGNDKEILSLENITIEHVMPQTLTVEWKNMLGDNYEEVHNKLIHTLGNLSVTGYNSTLSNKKFEEKKELLVESKAVKLNKYILECSAWNYETILARADSLSIILLDKFGIEKIIDNSIEFDYLQKITLGDYSMVTGKQLISFNFKGENFRQSKYKLMLYDIVNRIFPRMTA